MLLTNSLILEVKELIFLMFYPILVPCDFSDVPRERGGSAISDTSNFSKFSYSLLPANPLSLNALSDLEDFSVSSSDCFSDMSLFPAEISPKSRLAIEESNGLVAEMRLDYQYTTSLNHIPSLSYLLHNKLSFRF